MAVICNNTYFDSIKKKFAHDGKNKFHVVADFDRTLTRAFVDGEKTPSIISELRKGNYISEEYAKKAHELSEYYHPIEIDPDVSLEKKKRKMHEWWKRHFDLLISFGLNKKHIEDVIKYGKVGFRDGVLEFLDFLHENEIPLIIFSAAGLGEESISIFLKKFGRLYPNIHIISNSFTWDEKDNAISVNEPIIHVMNKDETSVKNFSFYEKIKDRKNVLLLGDSIEDVKMVHGFEYSSLIKVGFLNYNINENLENYKRHFDVLVLDDGNMSFVNKMLGEIFS